MAKLGRLPEVQEALAVALEGKGQLHGAEAAAGAADVKNDGSAPADVGGGGGGDVADAAVEDAGAR